MGRPQVHDSALRETLLTAAAAQVFEHGMATLSLRSLANDAGTTTAAIYTLFGNKAGLQAALYERAIDRFAAALAAAPVLEDPAETVVHLGVAYHAAAMADPHGYRIMFGDGSHPLQIDRTLALRAASTFEPLLNAVTRGAQLGTFPTHPPAPAIATALWANVHGIVTIELGMLLPPDADPLTPLVEPAIRAAVRGWQVPT